MKVFAISDLHLSFARPERRERYAARWQDHSIKVERNWREVVEPGDVVLLAGDISMARNHRELQPDLEWLDRLPGTKVLAPGNHDRWWNSVTAIRPLLRKSQVAVDGDAVELGGIVVCGTASAPLLRDEASETDLLVVARVMESLGRALDHAALIRAQSQRPIYLLWHFPPFDAHGRPGPWVERFEQARITACVYGHLHTERQWSSAVQGEFRCITYYCTSADAIGFRPLRVGAWVAD
jgi:predicted phosphohydrolase